MPVLWSGHFRVYYNKRDEFPFIWSVDRGDVGSERKFERVTISTKVIGASRAGADNRDEPVAWLQGDGKVLQMGNACMVVDSDG